MHAKSGLFYTVTLFTGSPPADEVSIARGQLLLLHTQLMYERQKRELHAERNRRLLSKIAKAEKVKQNNQTLVSEQLLNIEFRKLIAKNTTGTSRIH